MYSLRRAGSLASYRFLLTPRWIVLLVIAALSVPGCIALANWQFGRLDSTASRNDRITGNSTAPPLPIADLSAIGAEVSGADDFRAVSATGTYDTARQVFVRNRAQQGQAGFNLLTPLVTAEGPAVLVNRGFVAAPTAGGSPVMPPSPAGEVRVAGVLRPSQSGPADAADLPAGQVARIDVARLDLALPYDLFGGYLQLREQDPAPAVVDGTALPTPLELPDSASELLHRSYGWQWYVFAAIGPIGAALLARREAAERAAGRQPAERAST
ncbi:MAG: SURF1 family cytochrome oxidase biogenesis protein [Sporichthyaceae bacterium]